MIPQRIDTPILSLVRKVFWAVYVVLLFLHWGWGIAAAALVLLLATGVQGERRLVVVPVPGVARIAIELGIVLVGLLAAFATLGKVWAILLAIVQIALLVLNLKRFHFLLSLRRA